MKINTKIPNIPVMVISNSANPKKVDAIKKLGAKDYLLKAEHRLEDLVGMVISLVEKEE